MQNGSKGARFQAGRQAARWVHRATQCNGKRARLEVGWRQRAGLCSAVLRASHGRVIHEVGAQLERIRGNLGGLSAGETEQL